MGFALLICAGIAIVAFYWYFLIAPVIRAFWWDKPLPKIRFAVLQINLVSLLAEVALVPSHIGPGLFLFPFVAIPWYLNITSDYWLLFETPVTWGAISAAAVLALLAVCFRQRSWYFAPALATATLGIVTLIAAEETSRSKQAVAIASLQPDCTFPGNFFRSLSIAGREFQSDYHILAYKHGEPFGWSFSTMDFYPIRSDTIKNLNYAEYSFRQCYGKPPVWGYK